VSNKPNYFHLKWKAQRQNNVETISGSRHHKGSEPDLISNCFYSEIDFVSATNRQSNKLQAKA